MYDFIIIGAGIVGLATGLELTKRYPDKRLLIIDKADHLAAHQTGHNSGVIHSGIYYTPGSLKAQFATQGCQQMVEFCEQHGVAYDRPGKIIAAVEQHELSLLDNLYERGLQNGLHLKKLSAEAIKEHEPNLTALAGLYVPTTGVVNYANVSEKMAELIKAAGGEIKLNQEVIAIHEDKQQVTIETKDHSYQAHWLISCAGLQSDRLAKLAGYQLDIKIIPFRGEYHRITDNKASLVKHLIYPVPDPKLPFLGVHFTRGINQQVKIGPNALLALAREGYQKGSFNFKDALAIADHLGFWRMATKYWKTSIDEWLHSKFNSLFIKRVQKYIPELTANDVIYDSFGIRAQALDNKGNLVDDFYIVNGKRSIHVCNAPSPAATASLPIGYYIVDVLSKQYLPR